MVSYIDIITVAIWAQGFTAAPQQQWWLARGKKGPLYFKPLAKASYDHAYAQAFMETNEEVTFLWRCLYASGQVAAPAGGDFAWVTRDELVERVDAPLGELSAMVAGPYE